MRENKELTKAEKKYQKQIQKNEKAMRDLAKARRTTERILPFKRIYRNVIECKNHMFLDILKFRTKDLTNISEMDITGDNAQIQKFLKMYSDDCKIVGINFPTNTKGQQAYYHHKINIEKNPLYKEVLQEKLEQLEQVEKESTDREYFLFVYGKTFEDVTNNKNIALSTLGNPTQLISEIPLYEKLQCIFKMTNKCTSMFNDEQLPQRIIRDDSEEQIRKKGYDAYLLEILQPRGGISFNFSDCVQTGDGFETCLYIYDYPTSVDRHWLTYIMNITGAITTIDIKTLNKDEVRKNLNRSVGEQRSRYNMAKNIEETMDAEKRWQELVDLYNELATMGEVVKSIVARVYLSAKTRVDLENIKKDIKNYLDGNEYKCCVNLNEQEYEWRSMFLPKSSQDDGFILNKREGQSITSQVIAVGNPFHFSSLNDKYGSLLGKTSSTDIAGNVIFDCFNVSNVRTSYNAVVTGLMGMGKSTILKKTIRDRVVRGDYVRVADVVGDFIEEAKMMGGTVIKLDGSSGIINLLQIMATRENEEQSYAMHINKIKNMYNFLSPNCSDTEKMCFESLVTDLYVKKGLIPQNKTVTGIQVTGLPNDVYPTLSDLLSFAKEKFEKENQQDTKILYRNIVFVLEKMCTTYSAIFDGHTSVADVLNEQFVVYDLSSLANLDTGVFDAQLFNVLTLCWANAVKIGTNEKSKYEDGEINLAEVKHFLLLLDESHKTINANKPYAVEQVSVYAREGRKFFAGIWLASQSMNDYYPDSTVDAKSVELIKTLFALAQYKIIFKQDVSMLNKLTQTLGGNLTATEIESIPTLERGECVMSTGEETLRYKVICTPDELAMFKGGV
ncbi:MAG: hypothetical protein UH241_04650 [Acutalibacteraceae bacterium]|nr:hypothetical protein [Acutalibacteraceae bacterium]